MVLPCKQIGSDLTSPNYVTWFAAEFKPGFAYDLAPMGSARDPSSTSTHDIQAFARAMRLTHGMSPTKKNKKISKALGGTWGHMEAPFWVICSIMLFDFPSWIVI